MTYLYYNILLRPLFNLLVFVYNVIPGHDIGIAIIAMTVFIKLILYPISLKAIRSQKSLQELQPKLEEIKSKYKDKKEELAAEMMKLYKENNVNPFSSCLPLLIQLPILIAVYSVFQSGLSSQRFDLLYPFIANPGHINTVSLGLIDLAKASTYLAIGAAIAQFFQAKMMLSKQPEKTKSGELIPGSKDENMAAIMNKQMVYLMPLLTFWFGLKFPGGLSLYWLVSTLLQLLQQYIMFKKPADKKI